MDWQTLLTNEAISNYIVFGAGLIIGLLAHFARKLVRKPATIRLEKQREDSLIELSNDAKERLKVTYKEQPVEEFHLTTFDLRNESETIIEDVHLKLYLDETHGKQILYEMIIDDPMEDIRQPPPAISCVVEESGEHYLSIKIPYLNESRNHKDRISIRIYSPKPIVVSRLVGGGKGWMGAFFDRVAFNQKLDRIIRESNSSIELVINAGLASLVRRWK